MPHLPYTPLADLLRPQSLDDYIGQRHLISEGKPLYNAIKHGDLHSMILWGPPGTGKTTLAKLLAHHADAHIIQLSAVLAGVKDIREAISVSEQQLKNNNTRTVLFIDEIHRFNKSQQDAFLPFVESGLLTLIGATTENPSFALNSALLSRTRVYVLKALEPTALQALIGTALQSLDGQWLISDDNKKQLAHAADGDARRLLNYIEIATQCAGAHHTFELSDAILQEVFTGDPRRFDNKGEEFYNQISALHKAVRGSDPNAALYWFCRMIDGGCDPHYIARRVLRMASEDIGNADPRGLELALNAWQTFERLGSPEGELAMAQAIIYLAICAKSNATYIAYKAAMHDVKHYGSLDVPLHIRNAPTQLMKELDYGKNYKYAHDEQDAFAAGENYFPEAMPPGDYYQPVDRGLEKKIKEKLAYLRKLNQKS